MSNKEVFDYNKKMLINQIHTVADDIGNTSNISEILAMLTYLDNLIQYNMSFIDETTVDIREIIKTARKRFLQDAE